MARVEFQHVSKWFEPNNYALRDFNLSVADGEFMVLVGPSGCGKSTTLRLLAGLEAVSEGELLIDGQRMNQRSPQQRNVAMVFQNYALYPHMSVRDNLAFPLKMAHMSRQQISEKVEATAAILDLTALLDRKPKQLSGGQRQRVAMGRALVRDPSVFLLDEPLSNLDAKLRAQIRADIAELQRRLRKTTLYVTHDQVEAMTLGDRVAVMNAGELQQVGTPQQLYAQPRNSFVARFIGNPGMNIIPANLAQQGDRLAVKLGEAWIDMAASSYAPEALRPLLNQTISVGVRPEAIKSAAGHGRVAIRIHVSSVEYLGHESLLYCELTEAGGKHAQQSIIARVEGQLPVTDGEEQLIYIDPASIYVFDQNGLAVLR
jgi:ABC-type sugar transport system ATPase subunit